MVSETKAIGAGHPIQLSTLEASGRRRRLQSSSSSAGPSQLASSRRPAGPFEAGGPSSSQGRRFRPGDLRRARVNHSAWLLLQLFLLLACQAGRHPASRLVSSSAGRFQRQANPQTVPYKTVFVTRACEWKSNLFVPKSNDILFAQPSQQEQLPAGGSAPEVIYEDDLKVQLESGRTWLSTESKALILALPISMANSFAGYEPACSIRLIVPRNMRILAKLTARKLSFAQEQVSLLEPASLLQFEPNSNSQLQQGPLQRQLWLNVSQNGFMETEERVFETEANVLAFRFLLERFASRQLPETRFQVILTAFQTLAENSDLASANADRNWNWRNRNRPASFMGDQQFICDQQRLISASLACDGFANCQDGQDEEPSICAALQRNNQPTTTTTTTGVQLPPNTRNQLGESTSGQASNASEPIWVRAWQAARDTRSLAGFLIGFLFVLILLTCCSCCSYMAYLLWRQQHRQNQLEAVEREGKGRQDRRLVEQNLENAARQAKLEASAAEQTARSQLAKQPQSILKKPTPPRRPAVGPPEVPTRGALSSSLSSSSARASPLRVSDFRPTPARRLTRPSRPAPLRPSGLEGEAFLQPTGSRNSGQVTSSQTGSQKVTTYHYSSASARYSEAYLQQLPVVVSGGGSSAPSGQSGKPQGSSPSQSSLI